LHHLEKKIRIQRSTADTHEGLIADGLHHGESTKKIIKIDSDMVTCLASDGN
jgi:hypothetical protein